MKKLASLFSFILIFVLCGQAFAAESAYQRVMRTGTLRCGYIVFSPYLNKDPNTGKLSGISYDYMNAIADEIGIKIEWSEETGWGTFHEGLNANRYDAMCVAVWQSGARARAALLTRPLYYNGLFALVREGDSRFLKGFDSFNDPGIKILVHEGDATQALRKMRFPKAGELSVPPLSDESFGIISVADGKADVLFQDLYSVRKYNESAKKKLVKVGYGPVQFFGNSLAVKTGEYDLKFLLDSSVDTLITSGKVAKIVESYKDDGFIPPVPGYQDK